MVLHGTSVNPIAYSCHSIRGSAFGQQCGHSAYFTCGCRDSVIDTCYSTCAGQAWAIDACHHCEDLTPPSRYPYDILFS